MSTKIQKAIEEAESKYFKFNKTEEGCQLIDSEYRYLYLNDMTVKQARKTRDELLGKTMMESYPGIENSPFFIKLKECFDTRGIQTMNNEFTYPDGKVGFFKLTMQPVEEGVLILSVDMTESKEALGQLPN